MDYTPELLPAAHLTGKYICILLLQQFVHPHKVDVHKYVSKTENVLHALNSRRSAIKVFERGLTYSEIQRMFATYHEIHIRYCKTWFQHRKELVLNFSYYFSRSLSE